MLKLLLILTFICLHGEFVFSTNDVPELPEKVVYRLEEINDHFKRFLDKYNKKYQPAELARRLKTFEENLININKWNRESPDGVYGITEFADMTFEEFSSSHSCALGNINNDGLVKYQNKAAPPVSLDWRHHNIVTGVKNQGDCLSCYVFSAIGNIESVHAKQSGKLIDLSNQQGLDCNQYDCKGGLPLAVMEALVKQGCMKDSDYPYDAKKGKCRTNPSKVVVGVTGAKRLAIPNEEVLKQAVAEYGPLSIIITVNNEFQHFKGGIFNPTTTGGSNHAVLLVGYGTDGKVPYWIIKNSWGANWCEKGYIRMIRGKGACRIGMYVVTATVRK